MINLKYNEVDMIFGGCECYCYNEKHGNTFSIGDHWGVLLCRADCNANGWKLVECTG